MSYTVEYTRDAEGFLDKLDRNARLRILRAIEEKLFSDPVRHSRLLGGKLKGIRRLRVGDYRVLFTIDNERIVVMIIAIGHRKTVYDYAQRHLRFVCEGEDGEDGYWVFDPPPTEDDL